MSFGVSKKTRNVVEWKLKPASLEYANIFLMPDGRWWGGGGVGGGTAFDLTYVHTYLYFCIATKPLVYVDADVVTWPKKFCSHMQASI